MDLWPCFELEQHPQKSELLCIQHDKRSIILFFSTLTNQELG